MHMLEKIYNVKYGHGDHHKEVLAAFEKVGLKPSNRLKHPGEHELDQNDPSEWQGFRSADGAGAPSVGYVGLSKRGVHVKFMNVSLDGDEVTKTAKSIADAVKKELN
ncbi:MAG: hypothetical protein ACI8Y7_000138 [Candidatus Woesearchaeota archaeon]|jgi:hypothetical protein